MLFLGRGKKADLIKLANELDESESNGEDLKIIELRAKILASDAYKEDPEFVKGIFEGIVSDRIDEEREQKEQDLPQTKCPRLTLIDITFCGKKGRLCADTGSSHSIAGEKMYQVFKVQGLLFQETTLAMSLADGQQTTCEALTTQVMIEIEGRSVLTRFIILPKAKGNRTLLGTDFLSSAGLVLDVKNACWYFWDNPTDKYPFGEELDTPRP
ncbi:uncharacterized protein TNCT_522951 [Trichonephila clavata]|uniref:Uncharacterized protein n=1 Tax=Trichonephila clavata TaxID=2740835 RepID=A0A8X6JCE4_TRICU|nr:uncharacterized protein TNCT_522951 [Trichonephila clavata]